MPERSRSFVFDQQCVPHSSESEYKKILLDRVITTKGGAVYESDQDDMVKGSGAWSLSFYENISLTDSTP